MTKWSMRPLPALVRAEDNPEHHLWNNGGTWWIHYTVHTDEGRTQRVRYSLETSSVEHARVLRDAIFALWIGPDRPVAEVLRALLGSVPTTPAPDDQPATAAPAPRPVSKRRWPILRVNVADSYEGITLRCQPPSTVGLRRLARFDRGANFLGTLDDDFYLASDNVHEPVHLVLWLASDGSQADDNTSRIIPVASVVQSEIPEDENGHLNYAAAAARLLYAWVKSATQGWGQYECDDDARIEGGDLLPTGAVERIFESARYNLPLDLSNEEEDFR